jgi:hypothetical protein
MVGYRKDGSMQIGCMAAMAFVAFGLTWGPVVDAQNNPAALGPPPSASSAAPPAVAERADELLRQMGDYIGSAEQFTFHANIGFDHVLPSGQKLQFAATEDVALQRAGGLYVAWQSDLGQRQFWYDGKSITLYDPGSPFYATEPAAPDLDAVLDRLVPEFDFTPPLSDFLGLNDVDGRNCHTLAFVEKDIDWQIWIEAGQQLTPCKLIITYKTQPPQPQFTAVFTEWDFAPRIARSTFTPALPPGTESIPFAPVVAGASNR